MKTSFYDNPPTYSALIRKLKSLQGAFPFLKLFPIGKSILGRKMYALGIGNLRMVNLFAGAFHAQEWLTCSVLVRFVEDICLAVQQKQKIEGIDFSRTLLDKGFIVVPMVNPDGVEIALNGAKSAKHLEQFVIQTQALSERSWQANARGVDLNHNYDANFMLCRVMEIEAGITGPAPRQYGGACAHSEPETKAMVGLCGSFHMKTVIAMHSQGEEIYYQYGEHTPPVSRYMASLFASYSGYAVCNPEGLASHAGFKDWFIEKYHRPGFTFEMGKGENPLPITDLPGIYERLRGTLAIASVL